MPIVAVLRSPGERLTNARRQSHEAREQLRQGSKPYRGREGRRKAAQDAEQAKKATKESERWTLARAARAYHQRVIEPSRTPEARGAGLASLEHQLPPAFMARLGQAEGIAVPTAARI